MKAKHMDHVTLRIPEDRIDDAIAFYQGVLGFEVEGLDEYRDDVRPIFTFRLGETCVLHVTPVADFAGVPSEGFDHVAVVLEDSIEHCRSVLEAAGVTIEGEYEPLGATGTNTAIYVTDPFGYTLELKAGQ